VALAQILWLAETLKDFHCWYCKKTRVVSTELAWLTQLQSEACFLKYYNSVQLESGLDCVMVLLKGFNLLVTKLSLKPLQCS